jgi:hypothetical protein
MLVHTRGLRSQDVLENWAVKSGLVVKVVGVQGGERDVDGNEQQLMGGPTVSYRGRTVKQNPGSCCIGHEE